MSVCLSVSLEEFLNFYFTTVYPVTGWFLWDIQPYASDLKFVGYTGVTWVVPWDHFGRTQGSFYGYSGITLRVLWDHFGFTFGTTLRVVWGHFEGTLQVLRGGTLGSLRGYPGGDFGSTLGSLWRHFRGHFGGTLGSLWMYVWDYFGGSLGSLRVPWGFFMLHPGVTFGVPLDNWLFWPLIKLFNWSTCGLTL